MKNGKSQGFLRSVGSQLNEEWRINSLLYQFYREECPHMMEDFTHTAISWVALVIHLMFLQMAASSDFLLTS